LKELGAPLASVARTAAAGLSGRGVDAKLLILIFHRVLDAPDPLNADEPVAATFSAQMNLVRSLFNVFSLREAAARLRDGSLPRRAACITFDDGYRNNREVAAPILAERGMPATFFIATGYLNDGRMWNDTIIESVRRAPESFDLRHLDLGLHDLPDWGARAGLVAALLGKLKYLPSPQRITTANAIASVVGQELPHDLMMTDAQVREMAAMGMEVGAHTVSHPILARIADEEARQEVVDSKRRLEEILGEEVSTFAYPNGRPGQDYGAQHPGMVRAAGFRAAVSTARGHCTSAIDQYQLPRLAPWDRTPERYALRLLRGYLQQDPPAVA
jgi:peptidoglycan/xylan/chitin deacetylase (PgdA/CDA1 family)